MRAPGAVGRALTDRCPALLRRGRAGFRQLAGGEFLLPIHHSTFEMSDEPAHEPMDRLVKAAGSDAARIVGRAMASQWKMEP